MKESNIFKIMDDMIETLVVKNEQKRGNINEVNGTVSQLLWEQFPDGKINEKESRKFFSDHLTQEQINQLIIDLYPITQTGARK